MKAGVLVGIRSVYIVLNEEEVMRLCCVNLSWAYRMLQLPIVYLLDVNYEHTHFMYDQTHTFSCAHTHTHSDVLIFVQTHRGHVYVLSSASCLTLHCDVSYLLNYKDCACWHIYKLMSNYAAVHSQCLSFQTNFLMKSIHYCLTSPLPFSHT